MKYVVLFVCVFVSTYIFFTPLFRVLDGQGLFDPEIKPGQVWVYYAYHRDNPFEGNKRTDTLRVIAVKGSYVQYVNTVDKDTSSSTKSWFLIGSELIKDTQAK